MRCELTDHEWTSIKPILPNKPRGVHGPTSRGGLTSKIHAVVDNNGLLVRLALTAGEPGSQLGRTVLQQDQAPSSNRNAP
jgi:transposase